MIGVVLHRFRSLRLIAPASACVLALTLTACSGGGSDKKGAPSSDPKKAAAVVKTSALKLGPVSVESAGPLVGVDSATRAAALAVAQQYLDTAINAPLKDGSLGGDYANVFDAPLRPAATGTDKAALTDAVVGKIDGYTEKTTPVSLSGLADQTGALQYLATTFVVTVKAAPATSPLTITRSVELTMAPTAGKHWAVVAYRVLTVRKAPSGTTTTTAKSGSTP
jgi:hypothetical protein